jgi:hypothetical protein
MALHRDIYWVGRQWAVTGFGVQAVDQRLKGAFDVEVARLWDVDLPQRMRALAWLKADDFDKALNIARARFPEPPRKSLPLVESILELIPPGGRSEAPKSPAAPIEASPPASKPPSRPLARNEAGAPASDALKSPVAPITAITPASRPPIRTAMGSKPAPPAAAPPKPPAAPVDKSVPPGKPKPLVAAPIEASVQASKPSKPLVAMIEPATPPAVPPKQAALPVETKAPAKLDAIEQSPAKLQPLALRIEHASAKFLARWRVRH